MLCISGPIGTGPLYFGSPTSNSVWSAGNSSTLTTGTFALNNIAIYIGMNDGPNVIPCTINVASER